MAHPDERHHGQESKPLPEQGQPKGEARPATEQTQALFSPDGKRVATASEDGTARLWPVDLWSVDLWSVIRPRLPRELTQAERKRYEVP